MGGGGRAGDVGVGENEGLFGQEVPGAIGHERMALGGSGGLGDGVVDLAAEYGMPPLGQDDVIAVRERRRGVEVVGDLQLAVVVVHVLDVDDDVLDPEVLGVEPVDCPSVDGH